MSKGYGRGGRGAALLEALNNPGKPPGPVPEIATSVAPAGVRRK